jgi:2,3-bisphosphoglycerate-independent phosphoglycerate mutase
MSSQYNPLVLIVLDGWGLSETRDHNAIKLARTPTYLELLEQYPHSSLVTSGDAVGLPVGQMGNSEVGHMNLGAGRVVYQDLTRIDRTIFEGDWFENLTLTESMARCFGDSHALHLVGLVSDGGVHSHQRHLNALLEMSARLNVSRVFVHVITDGRDTAPTQAIDFVGALERTMAKIGVGRVASIGGRYYAMDRDLRWDRTRLAYEAIARGIGQAVNSVQEFISQSYADGVTDEFIKPGVVEDDEGSPVGPFATGDSVIFFNFRADRARQLTRALSFDDFDGFERQAHPQVHFTTMTEYDASYGIPIAFSPLVFSSNLADVLAKNGLRNLRLAETEKYAHVTYFFNCGEEKPYQGEERNLVPSPKVPRYDLQPEMSAKGITEQLLADINNADHEVIICNFANADMVGHTGNFDAAISAVSVLDQCLLRIVKAVERVNGTAIITSDHGNAEHMWDSGRKCPHTAHTSNPVPVVIVQNNLRGRGYMLRDGSLRDVAPTILNILGLSLPKEMTGRDLRTWI